MSAALPNLLIVGAPRAGTTWLWSMLSRFDAVYAPRVKEPHFHLADCWSLGGPEREAFTEPLAEFLAGRRKSVWGGLMNSAADYHALYEPGLDAAWRLEATPNYFAEGRWMADRLAERLDPTTRIVVALRDPVARAASHYRLFRHHGWETLAFAQALAAGPQRVKQGWAPTWDYLRYSQIARPLTEWREVFGERLTTVTDTEIGFRPIETLARLGQWLGLSCAPPPPGKPENAAPPDPNLLPHEAEAVVAASEGLDLGLERAALASSVTIPPPLVSIGMPVLDGAATIRRALASLTAQTYSELEIVVCDNASTDSTVAIARELADRDSRISIRQFQQRADIQGSFRRALASRRGEYFLFAPADDSWAPGFIESAVRTMARRPEVAVCCGEILMIGPDGQRSPSPGTRPITGHPRQRWTRALMHSADASRLYGLLRATATAGIIPDRAPEGWDHYSAAKLAFAGEVARIPMEAMYRGRPPEGHYSRLIQLQEPFFWGRVFFARHITDLFRDDPGIRIYRLKEKSALLSFTLSMAVERLQEPRCAPLRWSARRAAQAFCLLSRVAP